MSIVQLPSSTVKLITSTQVITSVTSAVKELVENSLDAGATNIDVKLENNGLDRIEVKDDGAGISAIDSAFMGLAHHTSKISSFSDIDNLECYGFRGEALNALCQVGNVVVTTATSSDTQGTVYVLDKSGHVTSSKPTHKVKGTCIVVTDLFKNFPVRRQYLSNGRRAKEELRQVEMTVKTLAIINPQVRFTLSFNKCLVWQKTACTELRQGLVYMLGYSPARELHELKLETPEINIEALVPRIGCNISNLSRSTPDFSMVFINRRPVQYKRIYKAVNECVTQHFDERLMRRKSPVFLISFILNPTQLDVNLEPNKTRVLVKDEGKLLEETKKLLSEYYGVALPLEEVVTSESPAKKRKLDVSEEREAMESCSYAPEKHKENCLEISVSKLENQISRPKTNEPLQPVTTIQPRYAENYFPAPVIIHESAPNVHEKENLMTRRLSTESPSVSAADPLPTNVLDESISMEKWSMGHVKEAGGNFMKASAVLLPVAAPSRPPPPPVKTFNMSSTVLPSSAAEQEKNLPALDAIDVNQVISSLELAEFEKDWRVSGPSENFSERLGPVISPPRPKTEKNRKKPAPPPPPSLNDSEMDYSVSSQMGRRELASFTKFARDARPQIILENPGIAFTEVAVMLTNKWKALSDQERDIYEDKAREHLLTRKSKDILDARQAKLPFEAKGKSTDAPLISKSSRAAKTPSFDRCQIPFIVSIDNIRERSPSEGNSKPRNVDDDEFLPIGNLKPSGGWLCLKGGGDLCLISPWRLQEVVLTHRLLATHTIPLQQLPSFQRLDEELLGADNWNVLLSLNRTVCDLDGRNMVVSSPIIVKNGFRIQLSQSGENLDVLLTHVAQTISDYGVKDLKELLQLAITNGTSDLSVCRPPSVVNHIFGEAVRICRQDSSIMERRVLQELLLYWKTCMPTTEYCLHSKPICTQIHTIESSTGSAM